MCVHLCVRALGGGRVHYAQMWGARRQWPHLPRPIAPLGGERVAPLPAQGQTAASDRVLKA